MIYVVGNSRSGTKLIGDILGNSPEIFTFTELHFIEYLIAPDNLFKCCSEEKAIELIAKLFSIQENGFLGPSKFSQHSLEKFILVAEAVLEKFTCSKYIDCYLAFLNYYTTIVKNKKIACNPTPRKHYFIKEIKKVDPAAFFIYEVRDPRAVLLSQKKKYLGSKNSKSKFEVYRTFFNYHPIVTSYLWRSSIKNYLKYNNHLYSIKYEDFVENPNKIIESLFNHLKIAYDPNYLKVTRSNSSFISSNKLKGIYKTNKDLRQIELRPSEIFLYQTINKKLLSIFNYGLVNRRANIVYITMYLLYLPFYLILTNIMNFNKYKMFLNQ